MRRKKLWAVMCMMVLCAMTAGMGSCSKDDGPDGKESSQSKPDNWESQLYPEIFMVQKAPGQMGHPLYILDYGFSLKDISSSSDILTPEAEKEFYLEYEGKQYKVGDILPIPGNTAPVRVEEIPEIGGKYIRATGFGGWYPEMEWYNHEPIEYGYTLVWPQRNIRTKMHVYIKFNANFEADYQAKQATLKEGETDWVPAYWVGEWIDGVSLGEKSYPAYFIK